PLFCPRSRRLPHRVDRAQIVARCCVVLVVLDGLVGRWSGEYLDVRKEVTGIASVTRRRALASRVVVIALPLTMAVLLLSGCEPAKSHRRAREETPCRFRNPSGYHLDIRNLRVSGGEGCRHADRLVIAVDEGIEGGCGPPGCHALGFACVEHSGGLTSTRSGGGYTNYYAYSDAHCALGRKRARWRICFWILKHG